MTNTHNSFNQREKKFGSKREKKNIFFGQAKYCYLFYIIYTSQKI